jgi:hypothetical protein
MEMKEFDLMEGKEKIVWLCREAVLLGIRKDGCSIISLFQLGNFYVEVYFHSAQDCIRNIRCFTGTAELSEYLEEVDISGLFSEQA